MLRDITIGQYYHADSAIHRLDPRTKLAGTFIYIISLFLFSKAAAFAIAVIFLALVINLSKVPFRFMIRGLNSLVFLLLFTSAFNIFLTPGQVIASFGPLNATDTGIRTAVITAFRLVLLVIGSSLLTLTTSPNNLTDGMERILKPLSVFKVPVHETAMMMSIALRFIPILMEETDKIMKAQQARGADFEHGSVIKRIKSLIPILVPLFVSAFRRANDLSMAMEARGYRGGEGRTRMKPLKYSAADRNAFVVLLLYIAAIIAAGLTPFIM